VGTSAYYHVITQYPRATVLRVVLSRATLTTLPVRKANTDPPNTQHANEIRQVYANSSLPLRPTVKNITVLYSRKMSVRSRVSTNRMPTKVLGVPAKTHNQTKMAFGSTTRRSHELKTLISTIIHDPTRVHDGKRGAATRRHRGVLENLSTVEEDSSRNFLDELYSTR
jgi:hypothetical protein